MSIATCGNDLMPDTRMVLLKEIEDNAFLFYTNYASAKGADLMENPNASLLFYWEKCQRQVRIRGTVTKGSREKAIAYFSSRPENSQFSAIASPQSQEIELEQLVNNLENIINNPSIAKCPENWIIPLRLERSFRILRSSGERSGFCLVL
jgi:pyridoxamine 5'-phosphate oxidase